MAEILTRKMASTKICEGLVKLPSACSCIRGCSFPSRTGAIVSSPVFVGEKLARFGAAISSLTKCLWLAALYSLMSTRAGALPKIYRHTTKRGELCVVTACNERIACSKACYFLLPSADTRCELLKVVPRMKPQDHVPSSTFHGPIKQQKYGHRQSLDGDSGFFHCMHTS
jgi:hypothetical protein